MQFDDPYFAREDGRGDEKRERERDSQWRDKPLMGCGAEPVVGDIARTIALIDRSVYLWLAGLLLLTMLLPLAGWPLLAGSTG